MEAKTETTPQAVPQVRMTYEEFLKWAYENEIHAEWVDGEVIMLVAPIGGHHQKLVFFLIHLLDAYLEQRPIGEIFADPFQTKLGPDLPGRQPDMIFLAEEHMDRYKETHLDGPPDIAVEIVSPESVERDRGAKFREYEAAGVREYWLIDPERQETDFFRLTEAGYYRRVPLDEVGRFHSEVLPGFWLDPAWFWREKLPTYSEVAKLVRQMLGG